MLMNVKMDKMSVIQMLFATTLLEVMNVIVKMVMLVMVLLVLVSIFNLEYNYYYISA